MSRFCISRKVGLAEPHRGCLQGRVAAQQRVGVPLVGKRLVGGERLGFLAILEKRARKLQACQRRIAARAFGGDVLELLGGASFLAAVGQLQRVRIALPGGLGGDDAPVLHVLVSEHAQHDEECGADDVGPVLAPDLLDPLAPQLILELAEKAVVLICHANFRP